MQKENMSWKRLKKKASKYTIILAIAASPAFTSCVQHADQNHQPLIEVLSNYEPSESSEIHQLESLVSAVNYGRIENSAQRNLLRQELQNIIHEAPKEADVRFFRSLLVLSNQADDFLQSTKSVLYALQLARDGRASEQVFDNRVLQQLKSLLNGSHEQLSLGAIGKYATQARQLGLPQVDVEVALSELGKELQDVSSLQISDAQKQAIDTLAAQTVTVCTRILQNMH